MDIDLPIDLDKWINLMKYYNLPRSIGRIASAPVRFPHHEAVAHIICFFCMVHTISWTCDIDWWFARTSHLWWFLYFVLRTWPELAKKVKWCKMDKDQLAGEDQLLVRTGSIDIRYTNLSIHRFRYRHPAGANNPGTWVSEFVESSGLFHVINRLYTHVLPFKNTIWFLIRRTPCSLPRIMIGPSIYLESKRADPMVVAAASEV